MCIDRLYRAHERGEAVDGTTAVVYVSPLKALAVDIAENLERPLAEIADVAAELGLAAPDIRVAVRTGDTTSSAARRDAAHAAELRGHHARVALPARHQRERAASCCARSRPSSSTRSTPSRATSAARTSRSRSSGSRRCASSRPRRVGLSATQRPIETVGAPARRATARCPAIVDAGHQRDLDLALELPEGELEAVTSAEQMGDVLDRIADARRASTAPRSCSSTPAGSPSASRTSSASAWATTWSPRTTAACRRSAATGSRRRLRAGDLRALVATASLELGIDIGPVELVCQIGSPRSIATFLQRVGRSNHSRAGTPKGRLFPLTRDELVECAALLAAVRAGQLDAIQLPRAAARHRSPSRSSPRSARRSGAPTTSSR